MRENPFATGACLFRRLALLLIPILLIVWSLPSRVQAHAGDLDQSFGNAGKAIADFLGFWDQARDVAIQTDGRIVTAGFTQTLNNNDDFAVARFTAAGALDQTFGIGGKVVSDFFSGSDQANALVVQADGKILVTGFARTSTFTDFALARHNSDGSLDGSFGIDGKVTTSFTGANTQARDIALQSDGKIVVGGILNRGPGASYTFALTRYFQDGTLDTTFGTNGWVTTNFYAENDNFEPSDQLSAIAIQEDGAIVALGSTLPPNGFGEFAAVRYQPNGTLDRTFGSQGKRTIDFFGSSDGGRGIAIQPDGKIVVVGLVFNPSKAKSEFGIARLNLNGDLDAEFGTAGRVTDDFNALSAAASCVIVQPDSKIVVAGAAEFRRRNDAYADDAFAAARFNQDGTLDQLFGSNGRTVQDFGELSDEAYAIAIDSGGRLVLAGGSASFQTSVDFTLVRYQNNLRFPQISNALISGKKLFVDGQNFDDGADIFLNGDKQKTANDSEQPTNRLIAKKAGKKVKSGDKLIVRNSDGVMSAEYVFP